MKIPDKPWAFSHLEVLEDLRVSPDRGLSTKQVKDRIGRFGLNLLQVIKRKSAWSILVSQFKSLIVGLLIAASVVSFAFDEKMEGIAILVVIVINTVIGFLTELRAIRSMEALRRLGRVSSKVRRNRQLKVIQAEEIVPGDIVVLEGGDIVTADLRLIEASKLQADESPLTGESVPVSKTIESLEEEVTLAERSNMLFKGTAVTRGSGEGVVIATGMNTELGHISSLVEEAEDELTPLERRLNQLGHRLIWITLVIAVLVAIGGIFSGKDLFLMVETSIALAVAAIPEGLPIVATIALARGIWRMARRNALVNRLSSVETLGATSIIFTDKTGTLTENRMAVIRLALDSGVFEVSGDVLGKRGDFLKDGEAINPLRNGDIYEALKVGVLCNNSSLEEGSKGKFKAVGEPLEVALLVAGAKAGLSRSRLVESMPEVREEAFDPDIKMMATVHREGNRFYVAVKGAPEAVLNFSTHILTSKGSKSLSKSEYKRWLKWNDQMADEGLRVLAFASKEVSDADKELYSQLTFIGLVGLLDPPREEVKEAILSCQKAGIRVVMITGDQPITARTIGAELDLFDKRKADIVHSKDLKSPEGLSEEEIQKILKVPVFARVSPKQKLDLISLHKKKGFIVAMTGDGVNDAPALKKADIGIAMGMRGTQVAREAADMVLKDDSFSTIVAAIAQGRFIFNNIRKFVIYLLSCNISEVLSVALASFINIPLPILPLQILFLNLVTDVFPALALGVGEGDPAVMKYPPRNPKEPVLTSSHWSAIGGYGLVITFSVLSALMIARTLLEMEKNQAVSVSFLTLAFAQLWHVFNMRDQGSSVWKNDITQNPYVWGALALCAGLLLGAVFTPGLSTVLKVVNPGPKGWLLAVGMSLMPLLIGQVLKSRPEKERDRKVK